MPDAAVPPPVTPPGKPASGVKLLVSYGPLVVFFVANKWGGMFVATGAFMVATLLAGLLSWWRERHLPPMLLLTSVVVLVFGGLTLWLHDATFIQLKPTIIYGLFAALLFFGLATGRPTLKIVLEDALPGIDAAGWTKLTRNWALFFTGLMAANEAARRVLSFDQWLDFKVWGVTAAVLIFTVAQGPLLQRHGLKVD